MKRLSIALLIIAGLALAACTGASAPGGRTCQGGICVQAQVVGPVALNKPVRVIITVEAEKDIPGLEITAGVVEPSISFEEPHEEQTGKDGTRKWVKRVKDVKINTPAQLTTTIRFTQEGFFYVYGTAYDRRFGLGVTDVARVQITALGGTIYLPGTPLPITPGRLPVLTVTPGPSPTPQKPTPTSPRPTTPTRPPYP